MMEDACSDLIDLPVQYQVTLVEM